MKERQSGPAGRGDDVDELIRRAHDTAQARGDAGYADPVTGYFVFSRASLLANGRCCGSGCRHCPYGGPGPTASNSTTSGSREETRE